MANPDPDQNIVELRHVEQHDIEAVISLDERVTELAKPDYWQDIFERYSTRRINERSFLVACIDGQVVGYIVGAIRGWEFGSPPGGWVFGFAVEPNIRQQGVGEKLFMEISSEFKAMGAKTVRTMVPRQSPLHMAFFRSEGMVAGPYIQLEMELDD